MKPNKGKPFKPSFSAAMLIVLGILVATHAFRNNEAILLLLSIAQIILIAYLAKQVWSRFKEE